MNFKSFLLKVPDFRAEAEQDVKALPPFFHNLTPQEKDEYLRSVTMQRSVTWACRTAASAYNLGVIVALFFFAINGVQIVNWLQAYLSGK